VVHEWRSVRARRRREETVATLEAPDQAPPFGQDDSLALLLMCWHPVLQLSDRRQRRQRQMRMFESCGGRHSYAGRTCAGRRSHVLDRPTERTRTCLRRGLF
jgi:hypothetical protein